MTLRPLTLLLHETDPWPRGPSTFAAGLLEAMAEHGLAAGTHKGLRGIPRDHLILPHIDQTVTPPEDAAVIDALPHVINRGVHDIAKRRVSQHLLERDSAWDGPVIVKTDRNHGGRPERVQARRCGPVQRRGFPRWRGRETRMAESIATKGRYRVLAGIADVPEALWQDERLVVERFLPERVGPTYVVRWYLFFGSRYRSMRVAAPHPLVKRNTVTSVEFGLPVPESVLALRRAWGMDFGKIDYVLHEGDVVILDVNRTPSDLPPPARLAACRPYVPGLHALLDPARIPGTTSDGIDVDGDTTKGVPVHR